MTLKTKLFKRSASAVSLAEKLVERIDSIPADEQQRRIAEIRDMTASEVQEMQVCERRERAAAAVLRLNQV